MKSTKKVLAIRGLKGTMTATHISDNSD